jgi:hypothetical protein
VSAAQVRNWLALIAAVVAPAAAMWFALDRSAWGWVALAVSAVFAVSTYALPTPTPAALPAWWPTTEPGRPAPADGQSLAVQVEAVALTIDPAHAPTDRTVLLTAARILAKRGR